MFRYSLFRLQRNEKRDRSLCQRIDCDTIYQILGIGTNIVMTGAVVTENDEPVLPDLSRHRLIVTPEDFLLEFGLVLDDNTREIYNQLVNRIVANGSNLYIVLTDFERDDYNSIGSAVRVDDTTIAIRIFAEAVGNDDEARRLVFHELGEALVLSENFPRAFFLEEESEHLDIERRRELSRINIQLNSTVYHRLVNQRLAEYDLHDEDLEPYKDALESIATQWENLQNERQDFPHESNTLMYAQAFLMTESPIESDAGASIAAYQHNEDFNIVLEILRNQDGFEQEHFQDSLTRLINHFHLAEYFRIA